MGEIRIMFSAEVYILRFEKKISSAPNKPLDIFFAQLIMKSKIKYFSKGSIIADSHESSTGLMVITSGKVGLELPMDSEEADEENKKADGKTLLYVLERG